MQILILVEQGGTTQEFVISQGGFAKYAFAILDAQEVGARLMARESDRIAIPADRLLELRSSPHISVIDGMTFDCFDDEVDALAAAQNAATVPGAKIFLANSFHPPAGH